MLIARFGHYIFIFEQSENYQSQHTIYSMSKQRKGHTSTSTSDSAITGTTDGSIIKKGAGAQPSCPSTDLSSLDRGTFESVMGGLFMLADGGPCITQTASAAFNASSWVGTVSGGAAASSSIGCESLAAQYSNTTSTLINSICQLKSTVMSQVTDISNNQTMTVTFDVGGDFNIGAGGTFMASQSMQWTISADFKVDQQVVDSIITDLATSVTNDLVYAGTTEVDGAASSISQTLINASNSVVTQVSETSSINNNVTEILNRLNASQSSTYTFLVRGNVKIDGTYIVSQDMVIDQVISSAITSIMDSVVKTVMSNEVLNTVHSEVTTSLTNFNANNVVVNDDALMFAIVGGILAVVLIAVGVWFAHSKLKKSTPA